MKKSIKEQVKKYDPRITVKKGTISAIGVAIALMVAGAVTSGDVTFGNEYWAVVLVFVSKQVQNYYKNKN